MSDATKRTVTTTRHEYVLPSPTTAQELWKAINWAQSDLPENRRSWGDAYMVEARDDEIVIWWEET